MKIESYFIQNYILNSQQMAEKIKWRLNEQMNTYSLSLLFYKD